MTNQSRQPKGTQTGGQFAACANPESTVLLEDEPKVRLADPSKEIQAFDTREESHTSLDVEDIADCEFIRFDLDKVYLRTGEGQIVTVKKKDIILDESVDQSGAGRPQREYVDPKSDLTMAQREQVVRDIEADLAYLSNELTTVVAVEDGVGFSSQYTELLASTVDSQAELTAHQKAIIEQLGASESSFDIEAAVAERVWSTIEDGLEVYVEPSTEELERVDALVREYFKKGPGHDFDNGLGRLMDSAAVYFMESEKERLAAIVGED